MSDVVRALARAPAWLLAAALAGVYLIVAPSSADLAAQVYRADLFSHHGFVAWDGQWYGGHHIPAYSTLFPPLAAALGVRLAGALATVAAAALFERLALGRFGAPARAGTLWFAAASATVLLSGRLAFGLGVAVGLGALLALAREHRALGLVLAALTTLASPIAGLFVALAGLAWALGSRRVLGLGVAAAALAPAGALALAFPEGGFEPFAASAFWPVLAFAGVALALLPTRERTLRVGVALYALASVLAFALATPLGGNAARLGALFAGPLLACALASAPRRRPAAPLALGAVVVGLLFWQWSPPVRDVASAASDPAVQATYYTPLLRFLERADRTPGRVEIPFTRDHWEAAVVAPHVPLARGWERQLDVSDNALFYRPGLSASAYRAWLTAAGVRWVALPDAPLDYSARAESRLIRGGLSYLRPAWRSAHWRVYAVRGGASLVVGPGRVTALRARSFAVRVRRAGRVTIAVRFTPYWAIVAGRGCVTPGAGGRTALDVPRAERVEVAVRFALGRIGADGPRCRRSPGASR